ncbi:hypothetical protein BV378_14355 [Nostoc sp. RF31YmG]|nr:hypothetical protein BV378_14355 [Nostoc sp. RF31YmG]
MGVRRTADATPGGFWACMPLVMERGRTARHRFAAIGELIAVIREGARGQAFQRKNKGHP